jgi:serine/threonine-protein kinase
MEFVHGQPLSRILSAQGPMSAQEAASLGREICRALAAVHKSGLLHGDIKANNVMREEGGRIVLMDFGLGSPMQREGKPGAGLSGTPAYMAPELFQSRSATIQTDIYALGVLLFHLVTGDYPYGTGSITEILRAHTGGRPRLLHDLRPDLPETFVVAVDRALAADPAKRYQTAGEFRQALEGMHPAPPERRTPNVRLWVGAALLVVLLAFAGWLYRHNRASQIQVEESIAVLPFENLTREPENEYLADGIAEELITALTRVEGLRVISRTSSFRFRGGNLDLNKTGRQLRVASLLTGTIRRSGDRARINVALVRASDGVERWAEVYDQDWKDVFDVQNQIATAVAAAMRMRLSPGTGRHPVTPEAHDDYLQGLYHFERLTPAELATSIGFYQKAIAEDENFPEAWAGLARAYSSLAGLGIVAKPREELIAKTRAAALKAIALDPKLGQAHGALGNIYMTFDWQWDRAEAEFRTAIESDPKDATARILYAGLLVFTERLDEATAQIDAAVLIDPLSVQIPRYRSVIDFLRGNYADSEREIGAAMEIVPGNALNYEMRGVARFAAGNREAALGDFQHSVELANTPLFKGHLGWAYAKMGRRAEAEALLNELLADKPSDVPGHIATIYCGLGDKDRAMEWMEKAYQARDPLLVQILARPTF